MKRAKSASAGGEVSITYHPGCWNTIPPSTRWEPDFMSSFPTARPKGRFQDGWKANQASQQHKGPAKSGPDTGLMTGGYCVDGREGRDSRPDRNASDAGINGCASHTGYTDHSFREHSICADIPRYVEPEHYSSTCCGKCKHYLRVWRGRVWVCDNRCSGKHGFPTDYGNTCDSFEREDRGNL